MITGFSSSEQESQWSQASSGIWVPSMPRPTHHQLSPLDQDGTQSATEEAHLDRPAPSDHKGWQRYWAERGWPWRREPEITLERQAELTKRRAIPVDMKQGVYPFRGMTLTRADIEWLLETHNGRQGPVDWNDESQRGRIGLDLRGAVVEDATDLRALPLARLQGGLLPEERDGLTEEQCTHALLCLKRANLHEAHLERANLVGACLKGASLIGAHLEGGDIRFAHLEGADLNSAHLEEAYLVGAYLEGASLIGAYLEGASLIGAYLEGASLYRAHLEEAVLVSANLEKADLGEAHLKGTGLWGAYLEEASLIGTHLEEADLVSVNLGKADLRDAHLEGADLSRVHLEGADLRQASLASVNLTGARLANATGVGPSLVDVKWGETNLSVVDWSHVQTLGDEYHARKRVDASGERKMRAERCENYQEAHRANHQLAVILQSQGLVDDATRFAYRAKCLKRTVFWYDLLLAKTMRQRFQIIWPLLFSWALFLLAGYGYRLRRCLLWYIGIVLLFMLLYWWLDPTQIPWWVALGESVNVFHGRGAVPTIADLSHPVQFTLLTVVEAIIGLVIEAVFVATMIQRLFGK